jgi:hypothetical protein
MADERWVPNGHDPNPIASTPAEDPPIVKSLREVAEESYTQLEDETPPAEGTPPVDDRGDGRDNRGRFAPKDAKPGEQTPEVPAPPIDPNAPPAQTPPDPAAQASSNQAPAHWSENDRQMFGALPQEGKAFLLRRHTEMEGEFTRRAQSAATAIDFTTALAPVFTDPVIAESLQKENVHPVQAIQQWADFHRRAMSPDPQVRVGLIRDLMQRTNVDPAAVGLSPQVPPGALSEADLKDPAIRFFADKAAQQEAAFAALRGELQGIRQSEQQKAEQVAVRTARQGIDEFAAQKDAQGRPLNPHFDEALPIMIELFRVDPNRDLKDAYERACWSTPTIRTKLLAEQQSAASRQAAADKAKLAARGNTRGITSPVAKPSPANDGKPKTLREVAEASADEIGF